jgi:Ca2+-binding EF-hand superfamily protein
MPAPLLLLAALAGAQMMGGSGQPGGFGGGHGHHGHFQQRGQSGSVTFHAPDRHAFISPMGEPFHVPGGDGLTAWFQQADRNHDGSITLDEMKLDAQRFFETLDTNHDGELDPDEVTHYETVVAPEVRTGTGFGGVTQSSDDEATGGGRLGLLTIPEPVTAADTNLDRAISAQEFQTAATTRFALLDHNGDGRLTLPELQATRSAIRANAARPHRRPDADPGPSDDSDSTPQSY